MHHFGHKFLSCLVLLSISFGFVAAGEPEAQQSPVRTPQQVADLVGRLEHPDFEMREDASQQLLETGGDAIEALVNAAFEQPPEAATRCLHILESLLLSDDKSVFEQADDGLTRLTDSDRGFVVVGATQILARHMLLREERAVAAIRELGGSVQYGVPRSAQGNLRGPLFLGPDRGFSSREIAPQTIILGTKWKGGVDGLKFLRWLSHREQLVLYVVRGSSVSLADAQALAAILPGLETHERGPHLGLAGGGDVTRPNECTIMNVLEGGPADLSGVKAEDIVLEIDGTKVGPFQELIEQLKSYDVGETITLTIDRRGGLGGQQEPVNIEVQLGEWTIPDFTPQAQEILDRARRIEASDGNGDPPQQADEIPDDEQ